MNKKEQQVMQVQTLGALGAPPPNGQVSSLGNGSLIIRGAVTSKALNGGFDVWTVWDGELFNGKGTLPDMASSYVGAFNMDEGELYIRSSSRNTVAEKPAFVVNPIPVVVRKGVIDAGSVGTHWFVLSEKGNTWIVLLRHPTEALGRVEVTDSSNPTNQAFISLENHYLELPSHALPQNSVQQRLVPGSPLDVRVQLAIKRAVWQPS